MRTTQLAQDTAEPAIVAVDAAAEPVAVQAVLERVRTDAARAWDGLRTGDVAAAWPLLEQFVLPLIFAVLILLVGLFASRILSGMLTRGLRRARLDETLVRFFGKLVFYAGLVFTLISTVSYLGIPMTSFAAALAAAGFAIGMALSGTLSSFAAGIMLLIFRPFKVGDVVAVAGLGVAKVHAIELFQTTLDTFDNRRFIVSNKEVFDNSIENLSHHPERRIEVNVGTDYDADLVRVREVLNAACDSLSELRVDGEGRGHQVYLLQMGASSIDWAVRFWAPSADFASTKEKLTEAVRVHLDQADISIPFPQMDVHLEAASTGAVSAAA